MNVVAHPDVETGRRLARGTMSTFARFNVMHGTTNGPMFAGATETLGRFRDKPTSLIGGFLGALSSLPAPRLGAGADSFYLRFPRAWFTVWR